MEVCGPAPAMPPGSPRVLYPLRLSTRSPVAYTHVTLFRCPCQPFCDCQQELSGPKRQDSRLSSISMRI